MKVGTDAQIHLPRVLLGYFWAGKQVIGEESVVRIYEIKALHGTHAWKMGISGMWSIHFCPPESKGHACDTSQQLEWFQKTQPSSF